MRSLTVIMSLLVAAYILVACAVVPKQPPVRHKVTIPLVIGSTPIAKEK